MPYTPGQQKCIETLDRSLVVSAGAGSGKTFTLTKRIAHAFQTGFVADVDQVLAITFTRKAAEELKSRLKAELRAIGLVDQALRVDEAWVSTIHGMCARMLRAHAVELGVDPAFEVAEGRVVDEMQEAAVNAVLAAARAEGGGPALDALFDEASGGYSADDVRAMVLQLVDEGGSCTDGLAGLGEPDAVADPLPLLERTAAVLEDLAAWSAAEVKPGKARDAWLDLAGGVADACGGLLGQPGEDPAAFARAALAALAPMKFPRNFGGSAFKEASAPVAAVWRQVVMELRLCAAQGHLATLAVLAGRVLEELAVRKARLGLLDNNDLLVQAARMMQDHPDIAAQYADRFRLVMVDEFQDTDQMQVDMVRRLAGPNACRLCTVGDAQQSIYRFRGADVLVYRRHLAAVRAHNEQDVILLPDNFRSHRDVLAFVDCVFGQPSMFGGEFMSLAAGRSEDGVARPFLGMGPRVQVLATTYGYHKGVSRGDAVRVAAVRVAGAFAQFIREGHAAGDMVLLLGRMAHSEEYARALRERGIACVVAGGSVFAESPEAAAVAALVRFIANPRDREALFQVLQGPAFSLQAADFLVLATRVDAGKGTGDARGDAPCRRSLDAGLAALWADWRRGELPAGVSPQLACAVRVLGGVQAAARKRTVERLLQQVARESGWIQRLEAQGPEGLAAAGNAYKAIRMVGDLERSRAYAFGPTQLAFAYARTLEVAKEAPGALSATGGDFVRIMTIHASKGLEFPIVAVAEVDAGRDRLPRLLVKQVEGRVWASLDLGGMEGLARLDAASQHALYGELLGEGLSEDDLVAAAARAHGALERRAALAESETLGDAEEAKRLLYVALTRAKEALVVSCVGSQSGKDGPAYFPAGALAGVATGLAGACTEGFPVGVRSYDFGGSMPAVVERVHLEDAEALEDFLAGCTAEAAGQAEPEAFFIPDSEPYMRVSRVPYRPARQDVFSYSSIADASHGGYLLARLAAAYCTSAAVEGHLAPLAAGESPVCYPEPGADAVFAHNRAAAVMDEGDGSWAYTGENAADSDKATDLGTAFHRLAQLAVALRREGGPLERPSVKRTDSLARTCLLDGVQRVRLAEALDRWFGSAVARQMSSFADLDAEVPFFLPLQAGERTVFLDGEIDLLGFSSDRTHAYVVDYKTGGSSEEAPVQLAQKHVLQAGCYALALLRQGVKDVDATFVRVEQPDPECPNEPQCVRFAFCAQDAPDLEAAVLACFANS